MARYQLPPDPRDPEQPLNKRRRRRQRQDDKEPIPWLWLGLGVLVTLIGVGVAFAIANSFLSRPPLAVDALEPTVIVLTAPPSPTATATPILALPTPMPTSTPVATRDFSVAPDEVQPDYYAVVSNTGGVGVTVRGGPSVNNARITTASEGAIVYVLEGPEESGGLLWWNIRLADGTEGWAAGDYLAPSAAPGN
jgi:hypothetical protein